MTELGDKLYRLLQALAPEASEAEIWGTVKAVLEAMKADLGGLAD